MFSGLSRGPRCDVGADSRKKKNKTRPINVIPAYQSEFIRENCIADTVCRGWKTEMLEEKPDAGWYGHEKALATEVWLRENKQEEHACGTSVGGKGGGWMWWKRGRRRC